MQLLRVSKGTECWKTTLVTSLPYAEHNGSHLLAFVHLCTSLPFSSLGSPVFCPSILWLSHCQKEILKTRFCPHERSVGSVLPLLQCQFWEMCKLPFAIFFAIIGDSSRALSANIVKCHVMVSILFPHRERTTSFWKVIQNIWLIKGLVQNVVSITLLFLWFAYHVSYLHQPLFQIHALVILRKKNWSKIRCFMNCCMFFCFVLFFPPILLSDLLELCQW